MVAGNRYAVFWFLRVHSEMPANTIQKNTKPKEWGEVGPQIPSSKTAHLSLGSAHPAPPLPLVIDVTVSFVVYHLISMLF